ncbi:MAG TPA: CAAX prenyl protease-related protein [Bryobacteraceae bacterium]|nr:CAAX prenyl protease-related protein [Bryobacteraceae bacterium]
MAPDQTRRVSGAAVAEPVPESRSALPWVLPFVVFAALLAVQHWTLPFGRWEFPLRVALLAAVLWAFSRRVITFATRKAATSVGIGLLVFAIWIAPDVVFPGYRQQWPFQNSITGTLQSSIDTPLLNDPMVLFFRSVRAILLVPIVEELFWRGWLMRWIVNTEFWRVPLGAWSPRAFWITAVLFSSEHGPYWDVGLVAGVIYNWWMVRTRSLGDCILAHAVTNAALSAYVIARGEWQYWL